MCTDITPSVALQVCWYIVHSWPSFVYASMILVRNISWKMRQIIYSIHSKNTMQFLLTGRVRNIPVWQLTGTIKTDMSIYVSQTIYQNPLNVCSIQIQGHHNMHPTGELHQNMFNASKWNQIQIPVHLFTRRTQNLSNPSLEHFCIMHV